MTAAGCVVRDGTCNSSHGAEWGACTFPSRPDKFAAGIGNSRACILASSDAGSGIKCSAKAGQRAPNDNSAKLGESEETEFTLDTTKR